MHIRISIPDLVREICDLQGQLTNEIYSEEKSMLREEINFRKAIINRYLNDEKFKMKINRFLNLDGMVAEGFPLSEEESNEYKQLEKEIFNLQEV